MSLKQQTLQTAPSNDATQPALTIGSGNYRAVVGVCVFLVGAIWVVFGQTLGHGFVNFDDDIYVYQNPVVLKGLTFQGISHVFTHRMCDFYHPLTMVSFMLDAQAYGLKAGGYHLTNILLHGMTAILLFLVLRQMMMDLGADKRVGAAATQVGALWPSAFVAAVFAIHPLRVESVAWVTERKDVLSGLFFVLTLGAYVRYTRNPFSLVRYLKIIFLFALGLLSKPSLVTLPFLLLLLDYWPLDRMQPAAPRSTFKVLRPLIIEKIPLFVLSTASCVATILTQLSSLAPVKELPLFHRTGYAAASYVVYLGQMFYPGDLAVVYPFPQKGLPLPEVVLALALLAGISVVVLALRQRHPYLVVGWLWYLGMLVPMIGMVHVGSVARADRFTYLAQIGVYILLTWTAIELTASWRSRRWVLGGGALVVLAVLIACARDQTAYWRDSESLWTHTLACTSGNSVAHYNLGGIFLQQGRMDEAIAQYQKTLEIKPDDDEAYNNLGNVFLQQGRMDEAISCYQKALEINPSHAKALNNLGDAFRQQGRMDEAIAQFQKALAINPGYAEVHNNLGSAFRQQGRMDEAIAQFQKALAINPDYAEAHYNLGNAFLQQGHMDKATAHFQQALTIKPGYVEAQNNMAWVLATCPQASLRNGIKAVGLAERANQLTGNGNPVILHTLAAAYAEAGRFSEAIETVQRALHLAEEQSNTALAGPLQSQLKLYQAGIPFHGTEQVP
jgi:tetratricopeptide (TPR) repeat protein